MLENSKLFNRWEICAIAVSPSMIGFLLLPQKISTLICFDKDKLVEDVMKAWDEYDEQKLAKMWEYAEYCLRAAIDYKGGNNYPRHRSEEEKRRVRSGGLEMGEEPAKKRQRGAVPVGINRRL